MMSDWKVHFEDASSPWQNPGGWSVFYDGHRVSGYHATEADAFAHMKRMKMRYPNGPPTHEAKPRTKGGPWRWRLPDGRAGVIYTALKADALGVLRYNLGVKRLPRGIIWEVAHA